MEDTEMKISIFGLGYVGCVSAACLASAGHDIIGVDVNPIKVDMINEGKSPIIEPELEDLIKRQVENGKISATLDTKYAVLNSDISFIIVGTPSNGNGSVNLNYIFDVSQQIGRILANKSTYHLIVIRSTVFPGTGDKVINIIQEGSGKKVGQDFGYCSNPEFLREGTAIHDFYFPPMTVIGQYDDKSGNILENLYLSVGDAPIYKTDIKVAEMLKYANNSFHALKITFANEIGNICKKMNIDSHKVMDIFCKDTKLNISPYYLKPGFAFGGSCLPKDVKALAYKGKELDVKLPVINSIMYSNELQKQILVDRIISKGKKRIGFLGLSFKENTDDLRESPTVDVIERLLGKGYKIYVYDENVSLSKLIGANKQYIEDKISHIASLIVDDLNEVIDNTDIIVIANRSDKFTEIKGKIQPQQYVIDLVKLFDSNDEFRGQYDGICW
jgi:GDP-mannose 6-dehydrogenase